MKKIPDNDAAAYYKRDRVCVAKGEYGKAITNYTKAAEIDPVRHGRSWTCGTLS
jgi:tetratricopeptide (TPR) repeat protein